MPEPVDVHFEVEPFQLQVSIAWHVPADVCAEQGSPPAK
jgi:hypothetical protein